MYKFDVGEVCRLATRDEEPGSIRAKFSHLPGTPVVVLARKIHSVRGILYRIQSLFDGTRVRVRERFLRKIPPLEDDKEVTTHEDLKVTS